jgi:glycosyltransferase involved in cell wall biosynthesis
MKLSFLALKGLPFPGGIERYMEEVGPRLAAHGHRVRVYSISYRTQVPAAHAGMEVRRVPALPQKSLEKPSAALLAATLEAFSDSDVVHVHAFGPSLFGMIPRAAGKKVVVQGHGLESHRSKWGWTGRNVLRFAEWTSGLTASAVTVVSRTQQEHLRSRYGVEARLIYPGVKQPTTAPPQEIARLGLKGNDFILFAARLDREKGAGYLIEAYRAVKPRLKLIIAGDNLLDDEYKNELRALAGNDPGIVFTGFATGRLLQELFSNCYVFVLPSEIEGLPISVLEAMSYGCCCLVSDIPENLEALEGHGFAFHSRDASDLARRLAELLAAPACVRDAGAAARTYVVQRFSWDRTVDELEALYRAVLAGQGRAELSGAAT